MAPFMALHVFEDGHAHPCDSFTSSYGSVKLKDYFKSQEMYEVRKELLDGRLPPQCNYCARAEAMTGNSIRLAYNEKFERCKDLHDVRHDLETFNLRYLYLSASNICNLKCLPCHYSSLGREKELNKLKIVDSAQIMKVVSEDELDALIELIQGQKEVEVNLMGGEAFYDKINEVFIKKLVEKNVAKDIRLIIITNLTHVKAELLDYIKDNFSDFKIIGSVDGIGATDEYIRYGTIWDQKERGVDLILEKGITLLTNTTLSFLSAHRFHEIFNWATKKGVEHIIQSTAINPVILNPNRIPKELRDQAREDLTSAVAAYTGKISSLTEISINACHTIYDHPEQNNYLEVFEYLRKHDNLRGTDFTVTFPELKPYAK